MRICLMRYPCFAWVWRNVQYATLNDQGGVRHPPSILSDWEAIFMRNERWKWSIAH